MTASSAAWVATQVQLLAVAGLASSHTAPFVRLRYNDAQLSKQRRSRTSSSSSTSHVSIVTHELPEQGARRPLCHREPHSARYSAHWRREDARACTMWLPLAVDAVEVQLWHDFADVAVFLGATHVSLRSLKQAAREHGLAAEGSKPPSACKLWYPLERGAGDAAETPGLRISVQLAISFVADERASRVQREIIERKRTRVRTRTATASTTALKEDAAHPEAGEVLKSESPSSQRLVPLVVDPAFHFSTPNACIEWSPIVAASVRRIFLRGDVDELLEFYADVLHGDMDREIEEDGEIHVSEDHLSAFRLCQFSAQYLDHCVRLLHERAGEYDEQAQFLMSQRRDLAGQRRDTVDRKRRLKKEHDDLELLLSTYRTLLDHHDKTDKELNRNVEAAVAEANSRASSHKTPASAYSDPLKPLSGFEPPPASPTTFDVSKKPAFLMTWEEREQARKQQKELDKARRIEDEKARLQRVFQDRDERERFELGIVSLAQRRRQRCAKQIQHFVRHFLVLRRSTRASLRLKAATTIQRHVRSFLCRSRWPAVREQYLQRREIRLMGQSERETVAFLCAEAEERLRSRQRAPSALDLLSDDASDGPLSPHEGRPVETIALVSLWRKLKRIFTIALAKGARSDGLFARLDYRADSVIDRAEFRIGVRYFGVRVDRKMTRALITLLRAKTHAPPRPLTLTVDQFVRGFDLPISDPETTRGHTGKGDVAHQSKVGVRPTHHFESRRDPVAAAYVGSAESDTNTDQDVATSRTIEAVARAVAELRERVLNAARDHLSAKSKSTADYFAFRQALTHGFAEFDVDQNGELDLHELVECMAAINFQVTPENLAVIRECFVEIAANDTISISEFISFALAGLSGTSSAPDEELGILGFRLRDAILGRIKLARKQADSIEDAVRLVFKGAYRSKHQQTCSRRDFVTVLASLRLGFTPAQLSRLVLRLDQDGDSTISFDELMTWLRLRIGDSILPSQRSGLGAADEMNPNFTKSARPANLLESQDANVVLDVLLALAGIARGGKLTRAQQGDQVRTLFRRIDFNSSGKINADELEAFFVRVDAHDLLATLGRPSDGVMLENATDLARHAMRVMDLNGNGVVTQEEWTDFLVGSISGDNAEKFVMVENVRQALRSGADVDENSLLAWFRSVPGAISIQKSGSSEMKIRVREFKSAVRARYPFISARELDEAVKLLDADGSGWVTEKELRVWVLPTRDLEELTSLISKSWQAERRKARAILAADFAEALYRRFDIDGNGAIARQELRRGFLAFQVILNDEEAAVLMRKFDVDGDGCWSRVEFGRCVEAFVPEVSPASPVDSSPVGDDLINGRGGDELDQPRSDGSEENNYSSAHSLEQSSSSAQSQLSLTAATTGLGVDYSEDFDT